MIPGFRTPSKLEAGDSVPLFCVPDIHGRQLPIETLGGRPGAIFFLPGDNPDLFEEFLTHLQRFDRPALQGAWIIVMVCGGAEQLRNSIPSPLRVVSGDSAHILARDFGLYDLNNPYVVVTAYVINRNLKISTRYEDSDVGQLAALATGTLMGAMVEQQRNRESAKIITHLPPVLVIPDAITPEMCEKCINTFRTGHTFKGTVGVERHYRPEVKTRTDHIVGPDLTAEIDDKVSRSVFPEIRKAYGVEITNRELYKIGEYRGDEGGHFRPHRDNFDPPMGYRRFALSIQLNDGFEGGGVRFNEYGDDIIAPPKGAAVVFALALLHEAVKVTAGSRFILLTFVHTDVDEAYRRQYLDKAGRPLDIKHFTPCLRPPPQITESRDFFWNWRKQFIAPALTSGQALSVSTSPWQISGSWHSGLTSNKK